MLRIKDISLNATTNRPFPSLPFGAIRGGVQ